MVVDEVAVAEVVVEVAAVAEMGVVQVDPEEESCFGL